MTKRSLQKVLRFGVFDVNLTARELRKHGVPIKLRGQPFAILAMLLERPGEIVTREEMRRQLWPNDTFVDFEQGLNGAVKRVRAGLSDSAEKHPPGSSGGCNALRGKAETKEQWCDS